MIKHLLYLFISLLATFFINLNHTSLQLFVITSLLYIVIFYIILILFSKSLINWKRKESRKTTLYISASILMLFVVFGLNFLLSPSHDLCPAVIVYPHNRTNIITGKCSSGVGYPCSVNKDLWYYKPGCLEN